MQKSTFHVINYLNKFRFAHLMDLTIFPDLFIGSKENLEKLLENQMLHKDLPRELMQYPAYFLAFIKKLLEADADIRSHPVTHSDIRLSGDQNHTIQIRFNHTCEEETRNYKYTVRLFSRYKFDIFRESMLKSIIFSEKEGKIFCIGSFVSLVPDQIERLRQIYDSSPERFSDAIYFTDSILKNRSPYYGRPMPTPNQIMEDLQKHPDILGTFVMVKPYKIQEPKLFERLRNQGHQAFIEAWRPIPKPLYECHLKTSQYRGKC
jgi:hypothetical protein